MIQAVWNWYAICREEATLIAEKLEISDFVASNGWLEKFKQKYSICNKTVAGEAGDVGKETMECWNQRAREIKPGWIARDVWNMDETGCFWRGLPEKNPTRQGKTVHWSEKSEATTNMGIFCKCGRGEGRSGCYVRQSEMLKELTVAKPAIQLLLFRQ